MAAWSSEATSPTSRSTIPRPRCTTARWWPTSSTTSISSRRTSRSCSLRRRRPRRSRRRNRKRNSYVSCRNPHELRACGVSSRGLLAGRLRYLPLGGLGEVGINMWALEWEDKLLVVDAGLMFPQEDMLGIDLVLPDISYLLQQDRELLGIFLTHGHEDHIGGLPYALKKRNVPVFGTRLTLGLVKPKLKEHRSLRESDLREVRVGDKVQLGPFRVETVAVG